MVSYETNATVIVRLTSLCTIVFGSQVCESSVTRQSMPPSGLHHDRVFPFDGDTSSAALREESKERGIPVREGG
jgi:hypothetical protein